MECTCYNEMLSTGKPFDLTVGLIRITGNEGEHVHDSEPVRTFGTVTVSPAAASVRSIRFEIPYAFENPVTGGSGKVIGIELSSFSVDVLITHENMETMYSPAIDLQDDAKTAYLEEQMGWINVSDKITQSMILTFADGTVRSGFGALRNYYGNGMVTLHCSLGDSSINVNELTNISIGNTIVMEMS